jgi:hypothetical protein
VVETFYIGRHARGNSIYMQNPRLPSTLDVKAAAEIESHPDFQAVYRNWLAVTRAAGRKGRDAEQRARGHAYLVIARQIERSKFYEGKRPIGPPPAVCDSTPACSLPRAPAVDRVEPLPTSYADTCLEVSERNRQAS